MSTDNTAGQQLRQARENKGLTLEQAAKATQIRPHYLQALEADMFDSLPSTTQAKGFLRIYASFLNLDPDLLFTHLAEKIEPAPENITGLDQQTPQSPALDFSRADKIFREIGRNLRSHRELLGLSLDEVEKNTHLKLHYLQALEEGNLASLPSPVQGRGMLDNYASFLGMDAETLLLRFAEGLQTQLQMRQAESPRERTEPRGKSSILPPRLRRFFSSEAIIGGVVLAVLISVILWGAIRVFSIQSEQQISSTAPSIADVLLASSTPTLTETPEPQTPTPPSNQPLFPTQVIATDQQTGETTPMDVAGNVNIYINVRERAWLRVSVDGEVEFEGRILPGAAYTFSGETQVEILVSSGSAIQIFFNQQDLGTPGIYGQVINLIYTTSGVTAPTATITPTIPATPTPTQTPLATSTPAILATGVPGLP